MKLNIPSGEVLAEEAKKSWLKKRAELSSKFLEESNPAYDFDVEEYQSLKHRPEMDYSRFITPMWQEHYDHFERLFLEKNTSLLQDNLVEYAVYLSAAGLYMEREIPYLEDFWPDFQLKKLLREDPILHPSISSQEYLTSESLVHSLTHLTSFQEKTGVSLEDMETVIEFGGGYGGSGRLIRRLCPKATHVVIDLPVMLFIQKYFLKNCFSPEAVNLVTCGSGEFKKGATNLVAIGDSQNLNKLRELSPDLFVATWSLSEANQATQSMVADAGFFDSKNVLIGYRHYDKPNPRQPCSDAIQLPASYKDIYRGPAFFSVKGEHHFWFSQKAGV